MVLPPASTDVRYSNHRQRDLPATPTDTALLPPLGPHVPFTPPGDRPPSPARLGDNAAGLEGIEESAMSFSSGSGNESGKRVRTKKAKVLDAVTGAKAIASGPEQKPQ